MLTVLYPHLLAAVACYPAGLLVLHPTEADRPILVIKGMKEAILAARVNRSFSVYVAPVTVEGVRSVGLITAFFDVPDEPMVVRSPLFADDSHSQDLLGLLQADEIDVHFFDEHSRELLAYRSRIALPDSTRRRLQQAQFCPFAHSVWRSVDDELQAWFGLRTAVDDADAVVVHLKEPLMPEDIAFLDATGDGTGYLGAQAISTNLLVREEPGAFQEHDIALLLQRIFPAEQIIRGPLRVYDKEEVADLLVVTKRTLIFVQAKDSPNTPEVLSNSLVRKRATALKSLKKAVGQLRGAIRYARRASPMPLLIDGKEHLLPVDDLEWHGLAILKEMFSDEYAAYSPLVLQLAKETDVPCIALDYAELNMFTAHLEGEEEFLSAIDKVFSVGQERGELPRLRIGPREAG